MRYLLSIFILSASLAFGQEETPKNLAAEDRADLLAVQLASATIRSEFALNQAKLNGCSPELIQNWREAQADLQKRFQAAAAKEKEMLALMQKKYVAEGYTLSAQLAWVKDPGN